MSVHAPVEAITLDAAGTLIRVAEPVAETYARIAEETGADLDSHALDVAFRKAFHRMPAMAFPQLSGSALAEAERGWWRRLVAEVVEKAGGVADFERYFDALFDHYAQASAWRVYADVDAALDVARARNLRLAVVSNFDSRLPGILSGLDIARRFDAVIYSTACGSAKPDAGIFRHALTALGASPRSAVHVGDDLLADYRGARAAGLDALLLQRRGDLPEDGVAAIRSLDELEARLGG